MTLRNAFGSISLEATQQEIKQELIGANKALQDIAMSVADETVVVQNVDAFADSGEREIPSVARLVTSQGDTLLKAPAPGKRLVLRWIYAVNRPTASSSPLINIRIGSKTLYTVWAVSKRQLFIGDVDAPLFINLSEPGEVALTALVEEV